MSVTKIRDGKTVVKHLFVYRVFQEAAGSGKFDTDQAKTDTPTLSFDVKKPSDLKKGRINRVHYRIKSANSVTFTLRIWADAIAGDYESNMNMLYESPSAQASDEDYDRAEMDIPFMLKTAGTMYYSLDLSAASGNVQGFIEVSGEMYE